MRRGETRCGVTRQGSDRDGPHLREAHGHMFRSVGLVLVVVVADALGWTPRLDPPLRPHDEWQSARAAAALLPPLSAVCGQRPAEVERRQSVDGELDGAARYARQRHPEGRGLVELHCDALGI